MKHSRMIPAIVAALLLSVPVVAHATGEKPQAEKTSPREDREGIMKRIDKNKDGKVSKDEFLVVQTERFAKMDKDGNGLLSKEELRAAREMHGGKMRRHGERRGKDGDNGADGSMNE